MMKITVRKIPLEDVLKILVLMREQGEEFVNFECDINSHQDQIHVAPYICKDPHQHILPIDMNEESEDQMKTIKRLLNGDTD